MTTTTRHIVLGGTGHLGSAAARALLEAGEQVTITTHTPGHGADWRERGAEVAVVDLADTDGLAEVLRTGDRALLVNPPADPSTDTDVVEHATATAIAVAVERSGMEKVVAASTYGARPGERLGDLSVLHDFEEMLRSGSTPVAVNRGAYYFSNWDPFVESARDEGVIQSMFPADFVLPMVDPADLGTAAARRLLEPPDAIGVRHVEGPARYSPADVARAFAAAVGHPVEVEVVEREQWEATYRQIGFSPAAAASYTRMTAVSLDELELPEDPERARTTLSEYVRRLVVNTQ